MSHSDDEEQSIGKRNISSKNEERCDYTDVSFEYKSDEVRKQKKLISGSKSTCCEGENCTTGISMDRYRDSMNIEPLLLAENRSEVGQTRSRCNSYIEQNYIGEDMQDISLSRVKQSSQCDDQPHTPKFGGEDTREGRYKDTMDDVTQRTSSSYNDTHSIHIVDDNDKYINSKSHQSTNQVSDTKSAGKQNSKQSMKHDDGCTASRYTDTDAKRYADRFNGKYTASKVRFVDSFTFKCCLDHRFELTTKQMMQDIWCDRCDDIWIVFNKMAKKRDIQVLDDKMSASVNMRCIRGHTFNVKPCEYDEIIREKNEEMVSGML